MSFYTIGRKDDKISSLMQINKEILEEDHFKDVTLVSDDLHVVKAHKALLSKSSDVFRQILMLQDDKNPIIFIRGSSQKQLKSILNFIYLGETEVTEEDINVFLQLAKDFNLKEFTDTKTKKVLIETTTENQKIDQIIDNKNSKDLEYIDNKSNKTEISMAEEAAEDDNDFHQNSDLYDPENFQDSSTLLAEESINDKHLENGNEMHEQNEMIEENTTQLNKKPIKQELSQESDGRIKCPYADCNKEFTKLQNMRVHYKVAHEGFALKCALCDYKTTRTNILRKHKQNNH